MGSTPARVTRDCKSIMPKPEEVVKFYVLCNKLKVTIRTGWKIWHVKRERLESIAEHIYGVQMLAIAMWSEYQYDVNLQKVILMLALHELEEIKIGDFSPFEITKEEKLKLGHQAVESLLSGLAAREELKALILEFDEKKTPEAQFASYCDKLEADLQCRLYDEAGAVDLSQQDGNIAAEDPEVKRLLMEKGNWSEAWLEYNKNKYDYDENFAQVSQYAAEHQISSQF